MASRLSFTVSENEEGATVITPCVDGVSLADLAAEFERSHGMNDPAGGYAGLIPDSFNYGPLDRYFLGEAEAPIFAREPGRIFALGCECGEVGCWPLVCRVTVDDRHVTWQGYEQPYRPGRDYSTFGPFVFDRAQYREALTLLVGRLAEAGRSDRALEDSK
jgi:hypothetical protein